MSKEKKSGLPHAKETFLQVFESKAGNISQTCKALGMSRQTFYMWVELDSDFAEAYKSVRESLIDFAEATLLTLVKEKNPTATIFFLKTQAKHRGYSE